jgi:protein SCO1/2
VNRPPQRLALRAGRNFREIDDMTRILWATVLAGCAICARAGTLGEDAPAVTGSPDLSVGVEEKLGSTAALDVSLKDEEGKTLTLKDALGKPTILTLNYFRCAGICTPLLNGLAEALGEIRLEPGEDFQVVTVSFDPRDTPEIAHRKKLNYLQQMKRPFPPRAWRFLTGEGAATKRLCDSVGFKFKADGEQFIHAGVILMLSPEGKVTRYIYGTFFLPSDLQMALLDAARGEVKPTRPIQTTLSDRFLQFCFSRDPSGRGYVFNMTKMIGAFTFLLALGFGAFLVVRGKMRKAKVPS